jgi:XisH protein
VPTPAKAKGQPRGVCPYKNYTNDLGLLYTKKYNSGKSMPAKDIFHAVVRSALEKEGWVITHDPLYLKVDEDKLYVDLGAENNLLGADRYGQKIAVEIKCFLGLSLVNEFH